MNLISTRIYTNVTDSISIPSVAFKIDGNLYELQQWLQFANQSNLVLGYEINIFGRPRALVYVARHTNKLKRQYRCEVKLSRIFQGGKIHFENDEEYEVFVPEIKRAIEQYISRNKIATFAG